MTDGLGYLKFMWDKFIDQRSSREEEADGNIFRLHFKICFHLENRFINLNVVLYTGC